MSDLEQQASTWVPPWQRHAPEPATPASEAEPEIVTDGVDAAAPPVAGDDAHEAVTVAAGTPDLAAAVAARLAQSLTQADAVDLAAEAKAAAKRAAELEVDESEDLSNVDDTAKAGETAGEAAGKASKKRAKAKAAQAEAAAQADAANAGPALALEPLPAVSHEQLVPVLEAILMVVDEPVSEITLAQVLDLPAEEIAGVLIELAAQYSAEGKGFDLRRAAGGWRFYTRAEYASYVERFVLDGQQLRLTQASLETLAVVAYKQPVTRSRVSAIRGVNCDGVIRTLVTRGMIEECGTEPESGAHLYRTTTLFLEKMGLDSVAQLPPLAPFLPDNLEELAASE